ncbi:hypothetical protein ACQ4PT_040401 [Festuca glaucescens]
MEVAMMGQPTGAVKGTSAAATPGHGGGGANSTQSHLEKGMVAEKLPAGEAAGSSKSGEQVVNMMARLRLTAVESGAVVFDDTQDLNLVDPDKAFVGKVLAPNKLHIQTISSAMRPAWGNPRGLVFNPAGNNLFIAEFGSKADRDRVMEGSPWTVGKHAVLMKKYDVDVQPTEVVFDRHSFLACKDPADRDDNDELPYSLNKLSPPEELAKRTGEAKSGHTAASTGGDHSGPGSRGSASGTNIGAGRGRGRGVYVEKDKAEEEVPSPDKGGRGGRGRGRSSRGRGRNNNAAAGHELFPAKTRATTTSGGKHKAVKTQIPRL